MANFSLKILDKSGIILYEDSAEMANLVVNREYEPGDSIIVETSEQNIHVWLQVDDVLGASFVYLTDNIHCARRPHSVGSIWNRCKIVVTIY